jgi:hypothetical protein
VRGGDFRARRSRVDAIAPVVAGTRLRNIAIDDSIVINMRVVHVGNIDVIDIGDGPVVIKIMIAPVPAGKTGAEVAKSVIDAAVEPDVRCPISRVPREIVILR